MLGQGDELRVSAWKAKLFDPFAILHREYGRMFKLSALLSENALGSKTASGAEAPAMWQKWLQSGDTRELGRLEQYNQEDVKLLAKLVKLPRVLLPGGGSTDVLKVALRVADLDIAETASLFPSFPPESPQSLQQGSEAWFAF